jgi:anion-transporting  ArsA/GET3 family ATPase
MLQALIGRQNNPFARPSQINESRRLIKELRVHEVRASHVFVNQLMPPPLSEPELQEVAEHLPPGVGERTLHALRLASARGRIQAKYLQELKRAPEVAALDLGVLELPLLAGEVTGPRALKTFVKFEWYIKLFLGVHFADNLA